MDGGDERTRARARPGPSLPAPAPASGSSHAGADHAGAKVKFTEVSVGFARVVNLGNFENARVEAHVKVALGDDENIDDIMSEIQQELRKILTETWKAQVKQTQPEQDLGARKSQ